LAKSVELKEVRDELKELRMLYKQMLDRVLPVREPTREERKAIGSRDELANERELLKALGIRNRD
jgi:hypothetical protein